MDLLFAMINDASHASTVVDDHGAVEVESKAFSRTNGCFTCRVIVDSRVVVVLDCHVASSKAILLYSSSLTVNAPGS